jgi:hypothetical protein
VALCKWDPIQKRLPFDPFLLFSANDDGRLRLTLPSLQWGGLEHFKPSIAWFFLTQLDKLLVYLLTDGSAVDDIYTDEDWDVPEGVHRFTMAELSKATGNFGREYEIGAGGFGKVFFGTLADGKMVAIKRASTTSLQGQIEFRNEVNLLSRLHHRHLVRLEGFCEEDDLQVTPLIQVVKRSHPCFPLNIPCCKSNLI